MSRVWTNLNSPALVVKILVVERGVKYLVVSYKIKHRQTVREIKKKNVYKDVSMKMHTAFIPPVSNWKQSVHRQMNG